MVGLDIGPGFLLLVCLTIFFLVSIYVKPAQSPLSMLSVHVSDLQLQSAGFKAPTPIQAQSWPIAMQNRDIVAIAKTGSGKTLGYLLPGFLHLERRRKNSRLGPTILVLAPTRELATQIQDECVKFGRSSRITSTVTFFIFCVNPFCMDGLWYALSPICISKNTVIRVLCNCGTPCSFHQVGFLQLFVGYTWRC